jgi:hypothetical protein
MNPPQERIDQFWIRQTDEIIASAVRKRQDQVGRVSRIMNPEGGEDIHILDQADRGDRQRCQDY